MLKTTNLISLWYCSDRVVCSKYFLVVSKKTNIWLEGQLQFLCWFSFFFFYYYYYSLFAFSSPFFVFISIFLWATNDGRLFLFAKIFYVILKLGLEKPTSFAMYFCFPFSLFLTTCFDSIVTCCCLESE